MPSCNIMFLKSLTYSTASQVVVSKISQTDVGLKLGSSDGTPEREKYGDIFGTIIFYGKEESILFDIT